MVTCIYKGRRPLQLDDGRTVEPFTPFDCSPSTASKRSRDPHFLTSEDFRRLVYRMRRSQLQQMIRNANRHRDLDLSRSGNTHDLKERLKGLLDDLDEADDEDAADEHGETEAPSRDDVLDMTVEQLREHLSERGLKVGGLKEELIERLLTDLGYDPDEADDEESGDAIEDEESDE